MIGSSGMDQDSLLAPEHSYSNDHWAGMNSYSQMSMSGYGGEYFLPSVNHGLPSESINSSHMAPPPVPQQPQQLHHQHHQGQHYTNQLPHQLMIPPQTNASQVSWPSLRTNPSQTYANAPVRIPPQTTPPIKQQPKLPSITTSTPRKTLTNEDRRRMCQYAEDHPNVKQTEIGLKFGVERSTVSKVLRKKDQYLNQDDRASSPAKKPNKGKNAGELERTLLNWVRNQQRKGVMVNDGELETQAKAFLVGTGSSETPEKVINKNWLEKFKQKNGLGPGKLIRRASETAVPDNANFPTDSPILSASQTPGGISPASPVGPASPPVVSATPSNEGKDSMAGFTGFEGSHYKHSQSATSLNSAITDPPSSTFSAGAFSPTSQFTFSPDPNSGMFDQRRLPLESSAFQRPRSQTFPTLDIEFSQQQSSEPPTPKYSASTTAPSSALESPAHEMNAQPFGVDTTISPVLHHSRSSSSLGGRSTHTPILTSAGVSSPSSPTQEDARRAADTLLNFMQGHGLMNSDEFTTIMRLTEKLRLHQQQHQHQTFKPLIPSGMGGLTRIPEGDTEMSNIATHLIVKDEAMMTG
ncbi:putative HTH CENPB-type domain-containing protein [Seiridium unicorne]|uniref:HTH CENPB-type domain-containing protein n=1 Tax=Seiridium unicorne TaxID=138068 RepID=A0ABR2V810_9PEZI